MSFNIVSLSQLILDAAKEIENKDGIIKRLEFSNDDLTEQVRMRGEDNEMQTRLHDEKVKEMSRLSEKNIDMLQSMLVDERRKVFGLETALRAATDRCASRPSVTETHFMIPGKFNVNNKDVFSNQVAALRLLGLEKIPIVKMVRDAVRSEGFNLLEEKKAVEEVWVTVEV